MGLNKKNPVFRTGFHIDLIFIFRSSRSIFTYKIPSTLAIKVKVKIEKVCKRRLLHEAIVFSCFECKCNSFFILRKEK